MEYLGTNKPVNKIEPLVSVCIQTYQHSKFIGECLDGILGQKTNFPVEIILGEDESTDGTREICIQYAEEYPDKLRLFLRSRKDVICINNTPTGRFNVLENLRAARGKYIAFCEGDDYWCDENKLQKQIDFLEKNTEYVICFHRVYELTEKGTMELSKLNIAEEYTYTIEDLARGNNIYTPTVVFRSGLVNKLPAWINESPVFDYVQHMLNAQFGLIKYLPEPMAVYRIHEGGIWSPLKYHLKLEKWLKVLELLNRENFAPSVKQQLNAQKRKCTEAYLLSIMNEENWQLFLEKLNFYSKEDEYISKRWLLVHYPRYISAYANSKSYRYLKPLRNIMSRLKV